MFFGICTDPDHAQLVANAGFDFLEFSVNHATFPSESTDVFEARISEIRSLPLPIWNLVELLPKTLPLFGSDANMEAAVQRTATVLQRASRLNIKSVCFGSGGARTAPPNMPLDRAFDQIAEFVSAIAPIAEKTGVTFIVENLNKNETNLLNSVEDCARIVRKVGSDAVRLNVDAFHWAREQESPDAIIRNADLISHCHIATTANRKAPGDEPCDFLPFAKALKSAGYDKTLSVEAIVDNRTEAGFSRILETLRSIFS